MIPNPNVFSFHGKKPFSVEWYEYMIIRAMEEYEVANSFFESWMHDSDDHPEGGMIYVDRIAKYRNLVFYLSQRLARKYEEKYKTGRPEGL